MVYQRTISQIKSSDGDELLTTWASKNWTSYYIKLVNHNVLICVLGVYNQQYQMLFNKINQLMVSRVVLSNTKL